MKSFQFFFSFLSLPLALVAATPLVSKRQQVSCPPGFRNAVFNTVMPGQGDVSNRWNTISSHGVSNWIGFTVNPLSQSPTYGKPAVSGAVDAAQIRIAMDPRDVPAAKALITSANPPTYLELFNEPDYSYMGFTPMTGAPDAASSLQDLINTPTSTQFISPAVAFTGSGYLSDFFGHCPGCIDKIPIISLHVYKPDPQQAIDQIVGVHNAYPSKKLWITELAPACAPDMGCTLDQGGVIGWMQTVVKWAAASGYVDKIFWNCGEWGPIYKDNPAQCNPSLTNPDGSATPLLNAYSQIYVEKVAKEWVSSFNNVLKGSDFSGLEKLFLKESYWRDQLCLSWNYHTFKGPEKMVAFLKKASKGVRLHTVDVDTSSKLHAPSVSAVDFTGKIMGVQSFLTVETDVGRGRGLVRLLQDQQDGGKWKAFTLFTTMHKLKGHEETIRDRRPHGVEHGGLPGRKNWQERRVAEQNLEGMEPTVLILGAGQAGLTAAARLKQLGVEHLIVDRNPRIGDNWRNRYHQLVLHDPVWYDHLPYVNFPDHWPVFTPKDKLGDWFESYAKILELNVWTKTTLKDSHWDEKKRQWTVTLERESPDGKKETRTLHPRHIIQATGHSGEMNFPRIKGMDDFQGTLCHSSQFPGVQSDGKGKHAIVVGCCNSGHDIAQDFYEHGYDVTMVQRSSTYVMRSKSGLDVLLGGVYEEGGPPIDDADLLFMSIPNPVLKRMHVDATKEIAHRDHDLHDGLTKAGFKLDNGPDDSGFFMKYFQRGGGYYIDVGASSLIADGKIHIKQGQEIRSVNRHSLTFADGEELPADEVVFATGYSNMRATARRIFGDELADRVQNVSGFDEEGELRTMWRRTGHPGFWFFGGNLALCRYFSRMIALQIKASEEGIMKYDDE